MTEGEARSTDTDPIVVLKQWLNAIKIAQIAHLRAAAHYRRRGRMFGIPVTIFTLVIGTSIFSSMTWSETQWILILAGVISLIAAVLSGLQTFLNYPTIAEKHNVAGVKYGKLRRRVEEVLAFTQDIKELEKVMTSIREEWNQLDEESPEITQHFHDIAYRFVKPKIAEEREKVIKHLHN